MTGPGAGGDDGVEAVEEVRRHRFVGQGSGWTGKAKDSIGRTPLALVTL